MQDSFIAASCRKCGQSVCAREVVINHVLGYQQFTFCLHCLSAAVGQAAMDLCELVGRYLADRACYRKEWRAVTCCDHDGEKPCCPSLLENAPHQRDWWESKVLNTVDEDDLQADAFCDTNAMGCGDLMIALMKSIKPLQVGQVLEVRALDPGAAADIPAWCNLAGHTLLAGPCGEDGAHYFIRKGEKKSWQS